MLTVNLGGRPEKNPQNSFGPVRKDLNWSYRASKHLGTFLLTSFTSRIEEMNVVDEFYAMFFLVMLTIKL